MQRCVLHEVAAGALGVAGTLVLTGSSAAQVPTANSCSNATLHGQYIFAGDGWQVASTTTPLAFAGRSASTERAR